MAQSNDDVRQSLEIKHPKDTSSKQKSPNYSSKGKSRDFISREVWLEEAYRTLIDRGIDNVKILNLADNLGVTRGSFYWRFESRKELFEELVKKWKNTNTTVLNNAANLRPDTLAEWYVNIMLVWLDKTQFDVELDIAIRDWARKDAKLLSAVEKEDNSRIKCITQAFVDIGKLNQRVAFTRARVLYYTQMGYYMLGNLEAPELRLGYLIEYCNILTGDTIDEETARMHMKKFLPLPSEKRDQNKPDDE